MENYLAIVTRNLSTAAAQGDLIVRHLLLPGHFDCCFRPIVAWLKANMPDAKFSVRDGYLPSWQADRHAELAPAAWHEGKGRGAGPGGPRRAEGRRMKPNKHRAPETIDESAECEITIQPDGRVFAFGITGPWPPCSRRSRRRTSG